jgi:acyl carrier protein
MSNADLVLARIQEAFKAVFDIDPQLVSLQTSAGDIPGWNSLGHLSLTTHLEQTFGISFDVDELMEMESVGEIVRIVSVKLSKKA